MMTIQTVDDMGLMTISTPKNWLITGGCGFIGINLIRHLIETVPGIRIRVLDNLSIGSRADLASVSTFYELDPTADKSKSADDVNSDSAVQLVVGDIRKADVCIATATGMDVVVHLAANTGVRPSVRNPRADMEANVIGTFNMLEAARLKNIKRFIFASSGAPIGECRPPIHEEMPAHPISPYGASKLAGEGYCSAYFKAYGLETVCLRFSNIYGPNSRHKNSVIAKFIKKAFNNETIEIYGDGEQTRDFIFIEDLIRAIHLSANKKGVAGETFQIATSAETSILEVLDLLLMIFKDMGSKNIKVVMTAFKVGDVKRNASDTTKASKYLGWKAMVDIEEGLKKTVLWYQDKVN
jgi:UDP-glucose 4-epimerase